MNKLFRVITTLLLLLSTIIFSNSCKKKPEKNLPKWLKCWEATSYSCTHYDFVNKEPYQKSDGFEYFYFDFHKNGSVDVYGHFTASFDTAGQYFFTELIKQGYSNKKDPFKATFPYTVEDNRIMINGSTLYLFGDNNRGYTSLEYHEFEDPENLAQPKRKHTSSTFMKRVGDRHLPK